jgi:hypothetical protein
MAEKVPKTSKVSMENCFFKIVGYNLRPFLSFFQSKNKLKY